MRCSLKNNFLTGMIEKSFPINRNTKTRIGSDIQNLIFHKHGHRGSDDCTFDIVATVVITI